MFEKKKKPSPGRQRQLEAYEQMVAKASPGSLIGQGLFRAFWVGGLICTLGQGLTQIGQEILKLPALQASGFASICLIFITALLTGIGIFDRIGKYAGAGTFVPISGFANSMVSAAMEFRREGMVLGLGAKVFTLAGPVLLYGITGSIIAGLITWLLF